MYEQEDYVIYLRKSRKDSELEALGIDVLAGHEKALIGLAEKMNLSISVIYREVVSGDSISARPQMQKLIREVEAGMWKGVLVMEVERLARGDTIDQGVVERAFRYSDTLIVTPVKIYNPADEFDQEYFEFGLFMSRREYKTIKRRMQSGRLRSVQDGFYVGNIPPYGYERIKAPDGKHFTLSPNDEAQVVKIIYDLYVNKLYGFGRICTKLNQMGFKPRKSDRFLPATVKDILQNPVYAGMLRWNWRKQEKKIIDGIITTSRPKHEVFDLYEGIHEPIITKELFQQASDKRGNWNAPKKNSFTLKNPLAGLIVCGECGRRMSKKSKTGSQPYDTLQCTTSGCKTVSCKFDLIEQAVLDQIAEIIAGYSGKDRSQNQDIIDTTLPELLSSKKKELEETEQQRLKIYDLLEKRIYEEDMFLERQKLNSDKKAQLMKDIESMISELHSKELQRHQIHEFIPKCDKLLKHYGELTIEQKNKSLKLLIKKIEYNKSERNTWGTSDKVSFSLEIEPFVPHSKS